TAGTDVALPAMGAICDRLHLPGPSLASARLSADKFEMKTAFEAAGVPTAKFRRVRSVGDCLEAMDALRGPWILKVVDSSGSRGIVKVADASQIRQVFDGLWRYTKRDFVLMEEYLTGEEFGAQALVAGGRVRFVLPHGDEVHQVLTGIPVGHYVPYPMPKPVCEQTLSTVGAAIRALGIDNAAVNADLMLCGDQVYVLEVGARSGATCLPELVSEHYGLNYYEILIRMALGEALPERFEPHGAAVAELLYSERQGRVQALPAPVSHPALVCCGCDYGVGDTVPAFRTGPDRIGQIVVRGQTLEEARQAMQTLKPLVQAQIVYD
ncbi:MAG: ATP-grasp domain-containing protein, partial [Paludibacteraceae bacterium]|nr:ATP-grasp domain-containing protein [Paludibacteraceae bacterium]